MIFSCNINSYGLTAINQDDYDNPSLLSHNLKYQYPPILNIPMMQARRMSIATKLACELYLKISKENNFDYALFLSHHGEIERSFKVVKDILTESQISPTDFSMSVHNAASGVSSILSKNTCEITSISAGDDGFINVFYEIAGAFASGKKRILLIAFDGEMPVFYQNYGAKNQSAYAIALLIEQGNDFTVTIQHYKSSINKTESDLKQKNPQPLLFWEQWQKHCDSILTSSILNIDRQIHIEGESQILLIQGNA